MKKRERHALRPPYAPENGGASLRSAPFFGTQPLFGGFRLSDAVFCVLFVFTAVFFFVSVRYGIQSADESFYFTIPYRMMHGDRLIVNEWQLSQLSALFQYLPMCVYVRLTGGVAGLILYFRQLYVAVALILFAYIYYSLREYGVWAVGAAAVFTGYHEFGYTTLNYYMMG